MHLSNPKRMLRLATGILIGLLFLVPMLYVVMISLESSHQFLAHPMVPPVPPSAGNFAAARGHRATSAPRS